ncbi:hypothetical protein ACHQM5_026002 [Ranunculus cassubicifolius]
MSSANESDGASQKAAEPEKPAEIEEGEPEEKLDLNGDNESEGEEESSEYEEVEEEVEVEVEEEVEEEEEEESAMDADDESAAAKKDEDEIQKHAELLALPPHGAEVYVGGIPQNASEEELKTFCESVGEVIEVRMMKGNDKSYAFVIFRTKELAAKAIEDLNNTEFKGKKIRCSKSQVKNRLFIGNVPKSWAKEDLEKAVEKVGPGINSVDLVKDPQISSRNRGFAFLDYRNHACAEYARQKMSTPKFKLGDNAPTVSWADSKSSDTTSKSQVKAVYVKNLPKDINQDKLKKLFKHHGEITKVILPAAKSGKEKSRIGFVHFEERSSAMKALKNTEKYEIDGRVLECSLAKPQADKGVDAASTLQRAPMSSYTPQPMPMYGGRGLAPGYGGFPQPMLYGGGAAMIPIVLPDGRVAYVMPQHGAQMHTPPPPPPPPSAHSMHRSGGRSSGGRSSGDRVGSGSKSNGRYRSDDDRGRRYNPY